MKVYAEGREIFSQLLLPGASVAIDLVTEVSQGTRLDFVVTPGAGTNVNFDHVDWNISILTLPTKPDGVPR